MFRRQLLRQARACRGLRASPSSLLASGSGLAPRTATTCKPAILTASISRQIIARTYSSATAAAEADNGGNSNGLITRFADLSSLGVDDALISAITKGMGYEKMTDVQAMSINPALQGKDLVAQARTGTGKTLGFLLPVLQKIIQGNPSLAQQNTRSQRPRADDIRGIIISPTRELAEQIAAEAAKLCRFTNIRVQVAVGGHNKREMLQKTRFEGCHLLVGTPGRLKDLLSDPRSGIAAPNLDAFVLDEADRLIEVGFEPELRDILGLLPSRQTKPRQTLLFSATIPKNVVSLARSYIDPSNFQFIQTINSEEAPTHEKVPQHIVTVPGVEHWVPTLLELAERESSNEEQPFKAIVFFNNTCTVKVMNDVFYNLRRNYRELNLPHITSIHSDLQQRTRTRIADDFRKARSAILISTDVTARGMDFPGVSHVIQFGVPPSRDQYIHRLGRTGRANKGGQGWLVVLQPEVGHARETLPGLPIKRNDELTAPKVDTSRGTDAELPLYFTAANNAMRRAPPLDVEDTYKKLLSGIIPNIHNSNEKQDVVDAVNHWARFQAGMDTLPSIRSGLLGRTASRLTGITFDDRSSRNRDDRRRGSSFSNDPFSAMTPNYGDRPSYGNRGSSRPPRRSFF